MQFCFVWVSITMCIIVCFTVNTSRMLVDVANNIGGLACLVQFDTLTHNLAMQNKLTLVLLNKLRCHTHF